MLLQEYLEWQLEHRKPSYTTTDTAKHVLFTTMEHILGLRGYDNVWDDTADEDKEDLLQEILEDIRHGFRV